MGTTSRSRACRVGVAAAVLAVASVVLTVPPPPPEPASQPPRPGLDPAVLTGPEPQPWVPTARPPHDDGPVVVLSGRGWGHSVGMSQYGALAQARAGRTYRDILGFYYPRTEVAPHRLAGARLRVGLFRNRAVDDPGELELASAAPGTAPPERLVEVRIGGEAAVLPLGEVWTLRAAGGERLALVGPGGEVRIERAAPALVRFESDAGASLLRLPGLDLTLRWGVVTVEVVDGRLRPTLIVPVERYLRGLAEMPSSWEPEALAAQAVAGRSYALRMLLGGLDQDCRCNLGTTPHDQAFAGWAKEGGPQGERWRAAVAATAGEVVLHDGRVAWTYYSSSHGGRTEAAPDSWAYTTRDAAPYLVSLDDPWSLDPAAGNPRAAWEVELPAAAFARAVGLVELTDLTITERTDGGSPAAILVEGLDLAGNRVAYEYRGWRTGIAGSDLKLAFRSALPSQQVTSVELRDPG